MLLTLFFRADGSLDGSGSCNATQGVVEQESALLRWLESVASLEILGRELTLRNNAGTIAVTAEQR